MGHIKEPEGVNFYVDSTPLTQEDKKQISDVIAYYKRTGRKMPISNILRILFLTTAFPISFGLPQTLNAQNQNRRDLQFKNEEIRGNKHRIFLRRFYSCIVFQNRRRHSLEAFVENTRRRHYLNLFPAIRSKLFASLKGFPLLSGVFLDLA
jgi:hypothetical protein